MSRLVALLAALMTMACSPDGDACARLPGGARYCLQAWPGRAPLEVQQKVDIDFRGRRETLIVQLEADAGGMRLVGTTPFGHKLLETNFDQRAVVAPHWPAGRLDPVLLLAAIQIALWDEASVREGLTGPAALEASDAGRRLSHDDRIGIAIKYTRGRTPFADMHIVLPEAGVELSIVNLETTDTP